MRDIEFRGKSKQSGKWVYGDYYKKWIQTTSDDGRFEHLIHWIHEDEDGFLWNYSETVDPQTVGQYTGLVVPHTEIKCYEKDVVEWVVNFGKDNEKTKRYVVEFMGGEFVGKEIGLPGKYIQLSLLLAQTMHSNPGKTIGNAIDNPELLKKP
jgi:hypothetical protein